MMLLPDGRVLAGSIERPQHLHLRSGHRHLVRWPDQTLRRQQQSRIVDADLPDGSILSYDVNSNPGEAQRLDPTTMTWVDAGAVPVSLEAGISACQNMGPGVLLARWARVAIRALQQHRDLHAADPRRWHQRRGKLGRRSGHPGWIGSGRRRRRRRIDGGDAAQRTRAV